MFAVTFLETCFEPLGKIRGELYGGKIPDEKERSSDLCVVLRAALAFSNMPLHPNQLDPSKGIVYECNVLLTKLATIHGDRLRVRYQVPTSWAPVPETVDLIYIWGDDLRERISGPVKSRFYRAKIAVGDLSDLLVRLTLELAQDEHVPVVLGELCHALLDDLP